jgi:hypothetical protein
MFWHIICHHQGVSDQDSIHKVQQTTAAVLIVLHITATNVDHKNLYNWNGTDIIRIQY